MADKTSSSPATLHDVAQLAGVSYQTVSRVVNHSPNVTPKTIEKVNRAIAELNYRPNRVARSLVTGKSNAIHLLVCDKYNFRMVPGMEEAAYRLNYQLRVTALHETYSLEELRQKLAEIVASQVDGLALVMPWQGISYADLLRLVAGTPIVVVGSSMGYETNSILIEQRHGTELEIQHLLDLGHRQFAEITGTIAMYEDARIRHETYEEVLREHGINPGPFLSGGFTIEGGYQAMERLLAAARPFTALVCANDEMALGAMHAAHNAGLRVPRDLSVVGFDDLNFAAHCIPPLTTVQQDYHALGKNAVDHLVSIIQNPQTAPYQRVIFPRLVVRESTAPPPAP